VNRICLLTITDVSPDGGPNVAFRGGTDLAARRELLEPGGEAAGSLRRISSLMLKLPGLPLAITLNRAASRRDLWVLSKPLPGELGHRIEFGQPCTRRARPYIRGASRRGLAPSPTCHAAARWFPRKWDVAVSTANLAERRQPLRRKEGSMTAAIPDHHQNSLITRRSIFVGAAASLYARRRSCGPRA
jgi:hypothetical protein